MGDNGRRRGYVRDVVDEDLPPYTDRGRYREYSPSPHNNLPRSRHHSRRSTWEEKDDTIVQDNVDMGETRGRLHKRGYDRSTSPDKQRSQSRRYGERSRSRGLEESRSRSPGRSRKSVRGRSSQPLDSDAGGRWKDKQEPAHGSKYHYDKAADKVSDAYYGENEPSRRPRGGGTTCRDFVKGNCRYGESCRFSHSTEDDSVDRSFRDVRVDQDHGRSICKFFLAGNCRRDNCRFSHDNTPLSSEIEDRVPDKREGWKGRLWAEPEKPVKISKWGESVDVDMDLTEDVSASRRGDERWGCSLENEPKSYEHDNRSNNRRNDENSSHMVAAMAENSPGEPQQNLTCNEFSSHSVDKVSPHVPHVQRYLSPPSANPQVSMASDTYKYQGMPEHNRGPVLENSNGQSDSPEIRSAFCDNSSFLKMEGQQMLSPISNVLKDDLNESAQAPIEQFAPLNTLPMPVSDVQNIAAVHVAKSCLEEFKTQLDSVLEPSTLLPTAPSQSLLHPVPTDCPQNVYAANDQKAKELLSSLSMINPQLSNLHHSGDSKVEGNDDSKKNLHEANKNLKFNDNGDNNCLNRGDDQGKEDGGSNNKDEKVMRLFKNALVELVKDILKPKWKEGKMSRDVYKTVVKKVVDKVSDAMQAEHVPKTQEKVELYLSANRPKISKLVEAYVERSLKG